MERTKQQIKDACNEEGNNELKEIISLLEKSITLFEKIEANTKK